MKIAVVGTGYVGLVTGVCLAETGNTVTCVDIDESKVERLSRGEMTIYEPGLDKLLVKNLKEKRLRFTSSLDKGIADAKVIFLALPTPPNGDGTADLSYILKVADDLGKCIKDYKVIVDKSTVPVGTADKVRAAIAAHCPVAVDVVSNPEFLREGVAVEDFMKPDRVVIGTSSEKARKVMNTLFAPFVRQGNPIIFMDERSAELTKYAANAFLATKITFMNEIANLCEQVGADVDLVRIGIGSDNRIGKRFLFPGIGYGGSCFPKDVQALARSAEEVQYEFKILDAVMEVNERQKLRLLPAMKDFFKGALAGKTIAVWGLAFKPNTDDIREAPALHIIEALLQEGAKVQAYDPEAIQNVQQLMGDRIVLGQSQYDVLEGADALLICTEWSEFRTPDFDLIAAKLSNPAIFDGRNLFELSVMEEMDFHYVSIGRRKIGGEVNG
jgi:UDPglucose 6-dehydrogenase